MEMLVGAPAGSGSHALLPVLVLRSLRHDLLFLPPYAIGSVLSCWSVLVSRLRLVSSFRGILLNLELSNILYKSKRTNQCPADCRPIDAARWRNATRRSRR